MKPIDKFERFVSNAFCNNGQSFYDMYVEANVNFRSKLGMKEVIIRRQLGSCCDWCAGLAGIFDAHNAPDDIYKRHRDCRCLVTYKSEKGYQDVWNKKIYQTQREARIDKLQQIEKDAKKNIQFHRSIEDVLQEGRDRWNLEIKDVTYEYFDVATPGKGNIDYETDDMIEDSADEKGIADFIHKKLGGDIFLIDQKIHQKDGCSPDSIWNEALWEYKKPTTYNAVNKRTRKGLEQIQDNPGGIVLWIAEDLSITKSIEEINDRIHSSKSRNYIVDIMIIQKGKIIKIIRYY